MKVNENQKTVCNGIIAQLNYWVNNGFTFNIDDNVFNAFNMIDVDLIAEATDVYIMNDFIYRMADIYDIIKKLNKINKNEKD